MSLLDQIKSFFRSGKKGAYGDSFVYVVRCSRCGEVVRVRADRRYDLQQDFDPSGDTVQGYVLNKEVLGSRCQQLMYLTVHFNRSYEEVERSIEGAEFVAEADYPSS